jgi:hypothetical protein
MSFLSHTVKSQQSGFFSSPAEGVIDVRAWRFASARLKELREIALTLAICLAIMTVFVALGVWIWVPYSHQYG